MRFAKAYVEITNICNRSCSFCPKTERKPAFMSPEDFSVLAAKLRPYTEYLYFHLMGEPLLHPQLAELLRTAGRQGFRVILTTNGTLLAQTGGDLLTAPALHKVQISLHSFEANEGGNFAEYLRDCCDFAKRAAGQGILVQLRLWNLDGDLAQGKNEKNGEIVRTLQAAFPGDWTDSRGGKKLAEHVFLSYGETFVWPSLNEADHGQRRFCYGLKDQIGVLVDGTVVPCCLDHEGDIPLGNLFTQELDEILQSPRTQAIVEGFRQRRAVEPLCRRCGYSTRFLK